MIARLVVILFLLWPAAAAAEPPAAPQPQTASPPQIEASPDTPLHLADAEQPIIKHPQVAGSQQGPVQMPIDRGFWYWFIAAATAAGTVGAVMFAVLKDWLWVKLRCPKLQLLVSSDRPYLTKTKTRTTFKDKTYIETDTYYYLIGVRNNGKSTAHGCTGVILEVYTTAPEGFYIRPNHRPRPVWWDSPDPAGLPIPGTMKVDIHPEETVFLSLGFVVEKLIQGVPLDNPKAFKINFFGGFQPWSVLRELEPGQHHRLRIALYSDNAKPLTNEWLELYWSGNWRDDLNKIKEELLIKRSINPHIELGRGVDVRGETETAL